MKNFVVYEENGKIIKSGVCLDSDLELQGDFVIETESQIPLNLYYIKNNKLKEIPEQPLNKNKFDYNLEEWVIDYNLQWDLIKQIRNKLLQDSDWTQLPDVPILTKSTWAFYRQQLRDITLQSDPFNIVWPIQPN